MREERKIIIFCIIVFIIGVVGVSLVYFEDDIFVIMYKNYEIVQTVQKLFVVAFVLSMLLLVVVTILSDSIHKLINIDINIIGACLLVILTFGFIGMVVSGSIVKSADNGIVKSYKADLIIDNEMTLKESYTYEIFKDKRYRMLYRGWRIPLIYNDNLNIPHVKVLNLSASSKNMIGYIVDYKGDIFVFSNEDWIKRNITKLIYKYVVINEVGFYNPCRYDAGIYITKYGFSIYPSIETDSKLYYIELKLADNHLLYKNVKINVIDKNNNILDLFVYPTTTFNIHKTDFGYVIEGRSSKNMPIRIEMLLKYPVNGFIEYVDDVEEKVAFYHTVDRIIEWTKYVMIAIIMLLPLIAYLIYLKFGKEKFYVVPEYLSYVPNKNRKPWIVNLIFAKDTGTFDENGFYATLLDLQNRGYIKITENGKVEILKTDLEGLDSYELDVMKFLMKYSRNNVFDPEYVKSLARELAKEYKYNNSESAKDKLEKLKDEIDDIMSSPKDSSKLIKTFLETRGRKIILAFLGISIGITIFLYFQSKSYPILKDTFYLSIVLVMQNIVLALTPVSLFSRWKNDYYKEKLEWDAFKNFLSDMAMIKKYSPEDISIWKDWLIYGTALGVGDKVVEAMKSLNIYELVADYLAIRLTYSSMGSSVGNAYSSTTSSSSGSSGGGFGGGGAGAR